MCLHGRKINMLEILEQIGVSVLGIVLYVLLSVRKYIKNKEARTLTFWQAVWIEKRLQYVYALALVVLFSIIIKILPTATETIKNLTGFDVANNLMSFFSIGFGILASIDSDLSKKQN